MTKRKRVVDRQRREKDRERKRQKRLWQSHSSQPPDDLMTESAVPCGAVDRAVSAPPGNLPGQGSMGLPPVEGKPLARVQASPRVKMHSNAPRLPSPRGSLLDAQNGGMAPSPDSPAWVCTPARVPGHDDGFKPSPAGQMQLESSGMEDTSRILKKDEGYKDSTKTVFSRVLNGNLNSYSEKQKSKQLDNTYVRQENKSLDNIQANQENKKLENIYESQENKSIKNTYIEKQNKNLEKIYERPELESSLCVQGSFHQGDPIFQDNAGTQCVANCLAGLSYHKVKNSKYWNTMDMDKVLVTGDELYTYLQMSSSINNRYLLIEELPQFFECFDRSFQFRANETLTTVIFSGDGFNFAEFGSFSLNEALYIGLAETDGCFVCFGGNSLLIGKSGDGFFTFDSHSRSSKGLLSVRGKSTRVLFQDVAELHLHIQSLAISMGYSKNVECNVTGVHCEVNNILDAKFHAKNTREQDVEKFKEKLTEISCTSQDIQSNTESQELNFVSVEHEQFFFVPLDSVMKRELCQDLNIPFICSGSLFENHNSQKKLEEPSSQHEIFEDGNCFFRAISFALTNSEDYHYIIRSAVCEHLLENEAVFKPFLRNGEITVKEHLSVSSMSQNGKWATEIEILAVCHLINIDIYTYTRNHWLKFSLEKESSTMERKSGAIYLNHQRQNHYNVVLDVCEENIETLCERTAFAPKYTEKKIRNRQRMQAARRVPLNITKRPNTVENRKKAMRRKYQEETEFRNKKLKAAYIKYKEDDEFQSTVMARDKKRYEKDAFYRSKKKSQSKARYAGNEESRKSWWIKNVVG